MSFSPALPFWGFFSILSLTVRAVVILHQILVQVPLKSKCRNCDAWSRDPIQSIVHTHALLNLMMLQKISSTNSIYVYKLYRRMIEVGLMYFPNSVRASSDFSNTPFSIVLYKPDPFVRIILLCSSPQFTSYFLCYSTKNTQKWHLKNCYDIDCGRI